MFGRIGRAPAAVPGKAALILAAAALLCGVPARAGTPDGAGPAVAKSDELRLEAIGHRLSVANADRCSTPDMLTGLTLHDAAAYDAEVRPRLAGARGLTSGFGLLRLVPGSSGERAGLRSGDEIVGLNGHDLAGFAPELVLRRASPERTERFIDELSAALAKGPAMLAVRRGDAILTLALAGERGCGGRFVASPGDEINAWADGRYVAVTAHMMRYVADDQELAFVVAHEMAHNILGHTAPNAAVRGKAAEAEADALAVELLASAGQDLSAPARFLRRSAGLQGLSLNLGHPGNRRRIRIVDASIARIERAIWAASPADCPPAANRPAGTANACGSGGGNSAFRAAGQLEPAEDSGYAGLAAASPADEPTGSDNEA